MTNKIGFLLLLLAFPSLAAANDRPELVLEDRVDLCELSHFYDEQGRLVFDQEIFWLWDRENERHSVTAWRLIKSPYQIPVRDWQTGDYVTTWNDGEVMRTVRAASYRETWLQYDPELLDREVLPKEHRRELRAARGRE